MKQKKKNLVYVLKKQMFGMFSTKKSKFVTLVFLLTSDASKHVIKSC